MKNHSFKRSLGWKYIFGAMLFLLLFTLPAKMKAQQFANVTVTWVGTGYNEQGCTDQGVECGFDLSAPFQTGDPDPRFGLQSQMSGGGPLSTYTVQTPDNVSVPYSGSFSTPQFSVLNHCGSDILVYTESWEEDNVTCGGNTTYDAACGLGDGDDDDHLQNFTLSNYQSVITEGVATNHTFNTTGTPGARSFTIQVTWNAAGPAAPSVLVPSAVCGGTSVTLTVTTALSNIANEFRWYSDAGLTTQVGTGASFNTPALAGPTSYWVAEASSGGCKGQATRVDLNPAVAVASPDVDPSGAQVCEGEQVILTASSNDPATQGVFNWWENSNATNLLFRGNPYSFTAEANTTIYCTEEVNGCQSPSTAVAINVNPKPEAPTIDDFNAACFDSPTQLSAFNTAGDDIIWYADPTGLNMIGTGSPFVTQELTQSTYFYAAAFNQNTECQSDLTPVLVGVTPKFEVPHVDNVTACVGQDSVTLRAHISFPRDFVDDFVDFNSFINASVRFVGNDAPLPLVIFGDVPSALDPANDVWDADVELTIPTVDPVFGDWDYSVPGTYSIGARVFNNWTGGAFDFSCTSDYGSASIFVYDTPPAPTAADATICDGQSASLVATGLDGATFTWYDDAALTHAIQVGAEYNTPALSSNTSYWVTQTVGECTSLAEQVDVAVNPAADMPFGTNGYTICVGQTIPSGQGLTGTCSDFGPGGSATANIAGTGAFPILVGPNSGVGGTVSYDATALPAGATVTDVTVDVTIAHTFAGDVSLGLNSPGATTVFVHNENGGNDNFGTGPIATPTPASYTWTDAGPLGPIDITSGDLNIPVGSYFPVEPLGAFAGEDPSGVWTLDAFDGFNLDGGQVTASTLHITYDLPSSPGSLTWWDAETGGTQVGSGSPFVPAGYETFTPGTYTYWAQCDNVSTCSNKRVAVTLTVLPEIAAPIVRGDDEVCEGSSATLTVANPSNTVEWYTDPTLSTIVHTGPTYTTPQLASTTTYYVVNNNGTCSSAPTAWTVTVDPAPLEPLVFTDITATDEFGNLAICEDQVINLDIILDDPANQLAFVFSESEPENLNSDWLFFTDEFLEINTMSDMIYYIRTLDLNTGCWSKAVPLYINVYDRPNPPQVRGTTVCVGEEATIYADVSTIFDNTGDNAQNAVYWADEDGFFIEIHPIPNPDPTGPPFIFNDSLNVGTFGTPGTYNFYVLTGNNVCYSVPQVVTVTVLARPEAPVVRDITVCEGDDAVLTASCDGTIYWYSDAGLTDVVHVGSEFPVTGATSTTTYYATCRNGDCESDPATATLTVNPKPEAPQPDLPFYVTCFDESITLFASNTAGDSILWYDDPTGLIEWATDGDGFFTTPELTQPAIFYAAAVDRVTGCRSDLTPVQVFNTPKFEQPRLDDVTVCADGDSVTLTAHVSFPRDLVTDFFDFFTFSNAIVRFVNTESPALDILGDAPVPLDPFNNVWEGIATLTIPAIDPLGGYDYSVPGTYDFGARTANFWFNVFTGDLFQCSSDYGTGSVIVLDRPSTPVVTNDGPVCAGGNVTISATPVPGGTYLWTGPNGFATNAMSFTLYNVTTAQAGTYTLVVTDVNGCSSDSATTDVVVNPRPAVDSVYSNSPLCEHETLNLFIDVDPAAPYAYQWSGPNGFTSTLEDPTIPDVTEVDNQGFYSVLITDTLTGCDTFVVILVQIDGFPDRVIADNDGPVCEGGTINLNASNVFNGTYHWTGPNGYDEIGQHQVLTNVTPAMSGIYTVTVTLPGGCMDSASTQVIVWPNPVADAGPDDTTYQDDPIVLHGSGGFTYQWVPNTYLDHDNIPNPVFNSPDVGTFPIVLTVWDDNHGCSDDDTVIIVVLPKLDLQIPDLITPNGDGVNDNWIIKYLGNITDPYTLDIYARGGAKVFSTTAYSGDWNGTYNGKELPDGGYWFVLAIEGGKTYKGSITIKR